MRAFSRRDRVDRFPPVESSLVRAVFVVLVLATGGAFLVTQSLKSEEPLVLRFAVDREASRPTRTATRTG